MSPGSAVTTAGTSGTVVWESTDALVADVQRWLDDPTSDHGWILVGDEVAVQSAKRFSSRDGTQPPKLIIGYDGTG